MMLKPDNDNGSFNMIGSRLLVLREKRGLSKTFLACKLQLQGYNIDRNAISKIESGERYAYDFEVYALAKIFDVTYEYLLGSADE